MGFWDFLSGSTPAGVISDTGQKVVTGIFDGVDKLISEFHLSPEEAQLFKLKMAEMQLDAYKTQISDVQSARQMQMASKSAWPGILTLVIVAGFYGVLGVIFFKGLPSTTQPGGEIVLLLIGSLSTALTAVLGYWFGTTQGNRSKDDMLANSVPASALTSIMKSPS